MKIGLDSTNSFKKLKFRNIKCFNWQQAGTYDRKTSPRIALIYPY